MIKIYPNLSVIASEDIDSYENSELPKCKSKKVINIKNQNKQRKNPDALFKDLFKIKEFIIDFFTNIVDGDLAKCLDFDTIELLNTELIKDPTSNIKRIVDVIYKIKLKDEEAYVVIILEIQSTVDHFMAARINTYMALLIEHLIKSGEVKAGQSLPLIIPFVFSDSSKKWNAKTRLQDLFVKLPDKYKDLECFIPKLEYCLIDLSTIDKSKLLAHENSLLCQMALIEIEDDIAQNHVRYLKAVKPIQGNDRYLSIIRIWFKIIMERKGENLTLDEIIQEEEEMIKHKPENIYKAYVERLNQEGKLEWIKEGKLKGLQEGKLEGLQEGKLKGLQEGKLKGLQEGKLKGLQEGKLETLLNLIKVKFGQITPSLEDKIKNSTIKELDNYLVNLLTATCVEDVLKN